MLKRVSILGYFAMVIGVVGLLWSNSLFSSSLVVIIPQALAVVIGAWARITFGKRSFHLAANPTAGELVTTGPYRVIRHPIYTAVCLFTVSGALAHWSGKTAGFAGLVLAGVLVRILCEEKLLSTQYPDYRQYAAKTWRMVPFLF
jgi:protein-S-isoprenylcysteine O-methyltransferase Ste14